MELKDFLAEGDRLFIAECYGKNNLSNENYDEIVTAWEQLKSFVEWEATHKGEGAK